MDKTIKQGIDEVSFSAKLSHKGKKAKWYLRNNVSIFKSYVFLFCIQRPNSFFFSNTGCPRQIITLMVFFKL